jgi:hypothetical protein
MDASDRSGAQDSDDRTMLPHHRAQSVATRDLALVRCRQYRLRTHPGRSADAHRLRVYADDNVSACPGGHALVRGLRHLLQSRGMSPILLGRSRARMSEH